MEAVTFSFIAGPEVRYTLRVGDVGMEDVHAKHLPTRTHPALGRNSCFPDSPGLQPALRIPRRRVVFHYLRTASAVELRGSATHCTPFSCGFADVRSFPRFASSRASSVCGSGHLCNLPHCA